MEPPTTIIKEGFLTHISIFHFFLMRYHTIFSLSICLIVCTCCLDVSMVYMCTNSCHFYYICIIVCMCYLALLSHSASFSHTTLCGTPNHFNKRGVYYHTFFSLLLLSYALHVEPSTTLIKEGVLTHISPFHIFLTQYKWNPQPF